jgi:Fur family ferric uptake transcriptional regulator
MSSEAFIFKEFLKKKNMNHSQPRETILDVFLQIDGHIEIKDLCLRVSERDELISTATVYRTMNLLVECGLARENVLAGDKRYFEKVYGREHHDHLVCTNCESIKEFNFASIEERQRLVAEKHSFEVTSHRMTLYGLCQDCRK